jgi:hypothetical protein
MATFTKYPPRVNPLAERGHNIRPERMHTIGENEHQAADADAAQRPVLGGLDFQPPNFTVPRKVSTVMVMPFF